MKTKCGREDPIGTRQILKRAALFFFPFFLLVAGAVALVHLSESNNRRIRLAKEQNNLAAMGKEHIQNALRPVASNVFFLASLLENRGFFTPEGGVSPTVRQHASRDLLEFSRTHRHFDQVRVIDSGGMELIRVNYNQGNPALVPPSQLQNKKHRYYFIDSWKLSRHELFVSPLDLNIERGEIEQPFKPMIRLATPVFDRMQEKRGIVIVNYLAASLLAELAKANTSQASFLLLTNSEGYFLKGMKPEQEWGFMFPSRKKSSMSWMYPAVWQNLAASSQGQIETPLGLYSHTTVFPLMAGSLSSTGSGQASGASLKILGPGDYFWKIIAFLPHAALYEKQNSWFNWSLAAIAISALIVGTLSIRLAHADLVRRAAETRLIKTNQNLEATVTTRTKELIKTCNQLTTEATQREKAQESLRDSEEKYRSIMESMEDYLYICSPGLVVEYMNPAMIKRTGRDATGEKCYSALYDRDKPCKPCYQDFAQKGQRYKCEIVSPKDGKSYYVSHDPVFHADETISKMTIFRDITCMKRAEAEKRKTESQYRMLVETMQEGVVVLDSQSRITYANKRLSQFLGYEPEEILNRPAGDFLNDGNQKVLSKQLGKRKKGKEGSYELDWVGKDGKTVSTLVSPAIFWDEAGNYKGSFGVVSDITMQKKVQREKRLLAGQLRQAQKLEAIGTLAGGIAHDFNNILMPVLGFAELAHEETRDQEPLNNYIENIRVAAKRASSLVRQILSISRKTQQETTLVNLCVFIKEPLKLLRASLPSTIEIVTDIPSGECLVIADPTEMHQVLMNLATNAGHAMRKTGGRLEISLREVSVSKLDALARLNLTEGRYIRLSISDTGHGISEELIKRIFDPYFTTKTKDEGTGLGLALVQGIVMNHNGSVTVYSELGIGTTFNVYLPAAESESTGAAEKPVGLVPTGHEHLLVVDDEADIVKMISTSLTRKGYQVTAAQNSRECLDLFKANSSTFDLLITDQTMPGLTGLQLAKEIRSVRPDFPIILATGLKSSALSKSGKPEEVSLILMKPILPSEMARAVRSVLDGYKTNLASNA
jgi:PAS domain S-box-containing protein